jgi:hypothetical protein
VDIVGVQMMSRNRVEIQPSRAETKKPFTHFLGTTIDRHFPSQ